MGVTEIKFFTEQEYVNHCRSLIIEEKEISMCDFVEDLILNAIQNAKAENEKIELNKENKIEDEKKENVSEVIEKRTAKYAASSFSEYPTARTEHETDKKFDKAPGSNRKKLTSNEKKSEKVDFDKQNGNLLDGNKEVKINHPPYGVSPGWIYFYGEINQEDFVNSWLPSKDFIKPSIFNVSTG